MNLKKGFSHLSKILCKSRQVQTCLDSRGFPTCQKYYANFPKSLDLPDSRDFPYVNLCVLGFLLKEENDEPIEEVNVPVMQPTH